MRKSVNITVTNSTSLIGFEKVGGGQWPVWDRFLTVEGKRAYHLGNICGTCAFFFERLDGANQSISATMIAERLNTGTSVSESTFITTLSQILPSGDYCVGFQTALPELIIPGSSTDYFVREQIALWGIDPFWGLPHHPRIAYYRGQSIPLGAGRQLFEFIIPMFPYTWLDEDRVSKYQREMQQDIRPTAFTLSILDIKQPANWEGEPPVTEHWCLAHYLLDGHHKTYAAARQKVPLNLISFLAIEESLAAKDQIETVLAALAQ